MNATADALEAPQESVFMPLKESGPLGLLLALIVVAIGIFHFTLLLRSLLGRRSPAEAAFHAILLFSGPCLTLLLAFAVAPTEIPGLFVVGIDAGEGLKHALALISFFSWLCLSTFVPNLVLTIATCAAPHRPPTVKHFLPPLVRTPLLVLITIVFLTGCVSPQGTSLRSRERRYNAALRTLTPGSTRADLDRLFPPAHPPKPFNALFFSLPGPTFPPETHRVDADFAVDVCYHYSKARWKNESGQHRVPSANTIDDLIFGLSKTFVRLYPRPTDRIANVFPLRVQRIPPKSPEHAPR